MKKKWKQLTALAFSLILVFAMAACKGNNSGTPTAQPSAATDQPTATAEQTATEQPSATAEPTVQPTATQESTAAPAGDVVTLQVFSKPSNWSGTYDNTYWADILKRDLGIKIELLPASDETLNALLASKDLPDIVVFGDYGNFMNAVQGDMLTDLDAYQAKLPNPYANAPSAVQYMRDMQSNGTGKCYGFPNMVSTIPVTSGTTSNGPYIRWDLYKQLGMPKLTDIEDYLPLLKSMMDLEPTNADGQKTYGISIWTDWDWSMAFPPYMVLPFYGHSVIGLNEINFADNTMVSVLDDNSYYKRALHWLFKANQMGILDPDSMTQKWNDVVDKATAGRVFFSFWSWGFGNFNTEERVNKGVGFKGVFFGNEKQQSDGGPQYIGKGWIITVGKNTKNMDKALAYVDYLFSYDGLWKLNNGDQGVLWDLDANGQPYVTEKGWKMLKDPDNNLFPNGGKAGDGLSLVNFNGMDVRSINPAYNASISPFNWTDKKFAAEPDALTKDWQSVMGAQDDIDYLVKNKLIVYPDFAPMASAPEDIAAYDGRIGEYLNPASWKMIFAKDENEFESIWKDTVEKCKGVGIDEYNKWCSDEYYRALSESAKYMK